MFRFLTTISLPSSFKNTVLRGTQSRVRLKLSGICLSQELFTKSKTRFWFPHVEFCDRVRVILHLQYVLPTYSSASLKIQLDHSSRFSHSTSLPCLPYAPLTSPVQPP
ncbi:hypothetical protein LINGRAHAP2_LOCUS29123 [Linum grandiflorum]